MRKVFFDNLPKRKSGQILWNKSIGQDLHFIYEEIEGLIKIVDYNTNGKYNIVLQYNDNIKSLTSDDLLKARIARLITKSDISIYIILMILLKIIIEI